MTKNRRLLVIDACVARSAGRKEHAVATRCRRFLEEALHICHRAVFSTELSNEWRKHQSGFAAVWQATMKAKGKLVRIDLYPNEAVRDVVRTMRVGKMHRKDIHLIEAALQTGRTIVSSDDAARAAFRRVAEHAPSIRNLVWVNPVRDDEQPVAWLRHGAPVEKARRLFPEAG